MSFLKNVKIESVRFSNQAHDTIEVMWEDEDGVVRSYSLPGTDVNNPDYKYLVSIGHDYERILEDTALYQKGEINNLKTLYRALADNEIQNMKEKMERDLAKLREEQKEQIEYSQVLKTVLENNKDDEAVFRAKLAVFEIPGIKESKDRNLKKNIRKSTSLIELFKIIEEFVE